MRSLPAVLAVFALSSVGPNPSAAHPRAPWPGAGSVVAVSVEVDGWLVPLYPAPDGSGRMYLEAHRGAGYAVRLVNGTDERVGLVLAVDGLNVISGAREAGHVRDARSRPGRMYVLDPFDSMVVRGWRTSLAEVRRFTFVDEETSYAARVGRANEKMGWIEMAVYRERHRGGRIVPLEEDSEVADGAGPAAPPAPSARDRSAAGQAQGRRESHPGTGWGAPAHDPARLVDFDPQPYPAERVTLRYEYASALRALGIEVGPAFRRGRLSERDRGDFGFAPAPRH